MAKYSRQTLTEAVLSRGVICCRYSVGVWTVAAEVAARSLLKLTEAGKIRSDQSLMTSVGTSGEAVCSIPSGTAAAHRSAVPKADCPAQEKMCPIS